MANELHAHATSGLTLYALLLDATGQAWNGSAFEAVAGANWTTYVITLTEAAGGVYLATMPSVGIGNYTYAVYEQAGGSAAVTDALRGVGELAWDGTAVCGPVAMQVIRDAMKLAPSAGAPAAGSVDKHLDDILATDATTIWAHTPRTLTTPTGHVAVNYPQQNDATLILTRGDDYAVSEGMQLGWTDTDNLWPILTAATITLQVGTLLTAVGSVIVATGSFKEIRVELTHAQTLTLLAGTVYYYTVWATLSNGHIVTLVPRSRLQVTKGLA